MLAFELSAVDGFLPMREVIRAYVSGNGDAASALMWHEAAEPANPVALSLMRVLHADPHGEPLPGVATLQFIAPAPNSHTRFEAWSGLAESQAMLAASRGAGHTLAEAPEEGVELDALRAAGFSPWMHQDVLKLAGAPPQGGDEVAPWLKEMGGDADEASARWLTARVVPKPLQKAGVSFDLLGLAHRPAVSYLAMSDGETQGWLAVYSGRRAFSIRVMFRAEAEALLERSLKFVVSHLRRRAQRPVYCVVPSFASWQLPALDATGFAHVTSNVLMIRTALATVRQPVWSVELAAAHQKVVARHNIDVPVPNAPIHEHARKENH